MTANGKKICIDLLAAALFWISAMFFGWVICSGVFGARWWLGPATMASIFLMALAMVLNNANSKR